MSVWAFFMVWFFFFFSFLFSPPPVCNIAARPNQFGMPGIVPPYVPSQMLNIPQTSLQAKPVVSIVLCPSPWEKPAARIKGKSRWERCI